MWMKLIGYSFSTLTTTFRRKTPQGNYAVSPRAHCLRLMRTLACSETMFPEGISGDPFSAGQRQRPGVSGFPLSAQDASAHLHSFSRTISTSKPTIEHIYNSIIHTRTPTLWPRPWWI